MLYSDFNAARAGAPSSSTPGSAQNGSLYIRQDGGAGTRLYTSTGSGWNAVTGS